MRRFYPRAPEDGIGEVCSCLQCGATFVQTDFRTDFCSQACADAYEVKKQLGLRNMTLEQVAEALAKNSNLHVDVYDNGIVVKTRK